MPTQIESPETVINGYLDRCRALVSEEMARIIPRDHAGTGGLYGLMATYPLREGKGLRPAICLATARLLGGYLQEALPTAVSLELFHNAFLVHDDIEDRSLLRRGSPTLNGLYGDPIAVNVGDAMFGLTLEPLLENTGRIGLGRTLEIFSLISVMVRRTAEGQMMELDWIRRNAWDVSEREYIRMVFQKTAWYSFLCPVACGCVVTGSRALMPALSRYASLLGVAFQIKDDILNLMAPGDAYGKETSGDLWEGKRTMVLIHALEHSTPAIRKQVLEVLAKPRPSPSPTAPTGPAPESPHGPCKTEADIRFLENVVADCGSLEYAQAQARKRADRAKESLVSAIPDLFGNTHGRFLAALADYVVERTK